MSKEGDSQSWPPPPTSNLVEPAPVSVRTGRHWGLVVGLLANGLAVWPSLYYFRIPRGAGYDSDGQNYEVVFHLLPVALLAFFLGMPLALWEVRRHRALGENTVWDWWAVALNLSPFGVGLALLWLAVRGLVDAG